MLHQQPAARAGARQWRGHYSDDRQWWWDDGAGHWLRTTEPTRTASIELEDYGNKSVLRSIATVFTNAQGGVMTYRFVARSRDEDGEPVDVAASATFPMLAIALWPTPVPEGGWPDEVRSAHDALDRELVEQGWRRVGSGDHWWSTIYERPEIDWRTPPDAYAREH